MIVMTQDIEPLVRILRPLVGYIAWSVRQVHGSILTMQFGEPHLTVREPVRASEGSSEQVRKHLARRRVFIRGDWQFSIENAEWEITTRHATVNSHAFDVVELQDVLKELDGQRLLAVNEGSSAGSFVLTFDLGASLSLRPGADLNDDQWSVHERKER
jgi:hypothetical protein